MAPKKVLVFGGTHGNEWTGIMSVLHYAQTYQRKFPALDLHFILANPEAYQINRRFKDEDLNRAFQFLNENRPNSYEHNRAREIRDLIQSEPCWVLDLHTTTANMGRTVIVTHYNHSTLSLAAGLNRKFPDCRIIGSPDPERKYLASQSDYGLMLEVGPVANGVVNAQALEGTLELLQELFTQLQDGKRPGGQLEIFEEVEDVSYPLDSKGERQGYIHPEFQNQDFTAISGSYTPFRSFSGENIQLETSMPLYPIFINEAAYYPQQLAYSLCHKKMLTIPSAS